MHFSAIRWLSTPAHSLRRYTKFLMVGTANAAVDLLVLNGLIAISPVHSAKALFIFNTIAVAAAIANSYLWNRLWTFSDVSDGSRREKWLFLLQAVVNILLNDAIFVVLSSYLTFSKSIPLFVSNNLAKGLAMLLSSSASYAFMRVMVFTAKGPRTPSNQR